jgi:Ca-activated chloride channel homolog
MPDVGNNITALVLRRSSSGRCALIAIWFCVSAIVAGWPQLALGGTDFRVQDRAPSGYILRSEVDLLTVNVQVKDKRGNNAPGLAARDFTVRENGKPQKIAFFDTGSGPVTVAVLVDSSSSLVPKGRLGSAQEIAARFMRIARPRDEIWAMDFTDSTGPFERITRQQLMNSSALTVPRAGGSGSSIYDAIAAAICHLRSSSNPRQAIIVITDGLDEHSRLSLNQLIDAVRSQRAQLFLIGFPSRPGYRPSDSSEPKVTLVSGHDVDNPNVVFDRLAKEGGAETFIPKSENGLQNALKAVANLLESEYTLAYYPARTSRKLRRIDVKVNRRRARLVRSRFLVANPDAADLVRYVGGTCAVSPEFYAHPYESHVTNGGSGTVYRDDFSDPKSGWPQHPDSHYVYGGYELSTLEQGAGTNNNAAASGSDVMAPAGLDPLGESRKPIMIFQNNVVAAYGPSWSDFRVSASMKAVFGPVSNVHERFAHPVHPSAGLVFRMNENGYYALLVRPAPEYVKKDKLAFEVVARTFHDHSFAESVIVPWTKVDHASPEGAQLTVEDVGDQITVFVNGQKVGAAQDDTFTGGYVGFTVSAPTHAIFSELLVEQQ